MSLITKFTDVLSAAVFQNAIIFGAKLVPKQNLHKLMAANNQTNNI